MDNDRKPNICPRMTYREGALLSNTWSIFIYIYLRVRESIKKYSKQMPAWAGGAIKQTGQQSSSRTTGNPQVWLDLSLPGTTEFHDQHFWIECHLGCYRSISFICTTRDWHWPASVVIGNIHSDKVMSLHGRTFSYEPIRWYSFSIQSFGWNRPTGQSLYL